MGGGALGGGGAGGVGGGVGVGVGVGVLLGLADGEALDVPSGVWGAVEVLSEVFDPAPASSSPSLSFITANHQTMRATTSTRAMAARIHSQVLEGREASSGSSSPTPNTP